MKGFPYRLGAEEEDLRGGFCVFMQVISKMKAVWNVLDTQRMAVSISQICGEMLNMNNIQFKETFWPLLLDRKITASNFSIYCEKERFPSSPILEFIINLFYVRIIGEIGLDNT